MEISKKYLLLAFLMVAAYAITINELNLRMIRKENPTNAFSSNRCLTYNYSVTSIDNEWYVNQIKYFLAGKGFTANPERHHYNVRRTPVYPLFYGAHYVLFGEEKSYCYIRYTQVFLFALSAIALFFAALHFTNNKKIALITAALYSFNLTLVSFLYYSITEAISPALVCFLIYYLSLCKKYNRRKDWLMAGLFFALASLCRPAIFFIGSSVLFLVIYRNRQELKKMVMNSLFFALGAGLLFVPYIIRNYIVTNGELVVLEKYYGDPMNYGMPNMELRKWISCWMNPADFSSEEISNHMKIAVCCDTLSTKKMVLDEEMNKLPPRGLLVSSKEEVREAYSTLYDYYTVSAFPDTKHTIDSVESSSILKIRKLRNDFMEHAPVQYYFITPLLFLKSVVLQSNCAPVAILDNYQGNYWKIAVKLLLYALNIYLFISLAAAAGFIRKHPEIYMITVLFVVPAFLYITFEIKYFEARYLIPMFPLMYITGAIFFVEAAAWIKKRLHF